MGPLQAPGQTGGLTDVFRQRYLLWLLVRKESQGPLQGLAARAAAGPTSSPIVRFCVYYFIVEPDHRPQDTQPCAAHLQRHGHHAVLLDLSVGRLEGGHQEQVAGDEDQHAARDVPRCVGGGLALQHVSDVRRPADRRLHLSTGTQTLGAPTRPSSASGSSSSTASASRMILSAVNVFIRDTQNIVEVVNHGAALDRAGDLHVLDDRSRTWPGTRGSTRSTSATRSTQPSC